MTDALAPQGTDLWREQRRQYLGCSELMALFTPAEQIELIGKRWYYSQAALCALKLGLWDGPEENPAMREGRLIEPAMRSFVRATTLLPFEECPIPMTVEIGGVPFMYSPDGVVNDPFTGEYGHITLEIKSNDEDTHAQVATRREAPLHHLPQLVGQRLVSRPTNQYYLSYHPKHDPVLIQVPHNPALEQRILDRAAIVWAAIQAGQVYGDITDEKAITLVIDDETFNGTARRLVELREIEAQFQQMMQAAGFDPTEVERLEKALKDYAKHVEGSAPLVGSGVRVSRWETKGHVDYAHPDIVARLDGLDLDQYRKPPTVSARLTITALAKKE